MAGPKNIQGHNWLAQDDLTDLIQNISRYMDANPPQGGSVFTSDAVGTTVVEIDGFSTAQTGSPLVIKQVVSGNKLFEVATVTSAATGLKVTSAAAAGGLALAVTSSGTDESTTFNAKGAGTITLNNTATGNVIVGQNLQLTEAKNVVLGTTTGSQIGTATSQKLGFYAATPIVQPVGAAQAAVAATGSTNSSPYGYTTAAQADAIVTLVNGLRTALVNLGLIKGAA